MNATLITGAPPVLLPGLDGAARQRLLADCRPRRFRARDIVFHEGDPGDTLHIVVAGRLAVRVTTPLGHVATLTTVGPGDVFGELALLDPAAQRDATVVALEESRTLTLTGAQVRDLRRRHRGIDAMLNAALAGYVRRLSETVLEALYLPVETRVTRRLARMAHSSARGNGHPVIRMTQDDLATMAGTTRATANRVLQGLVARGVLGLRRGAITVLDRGALERATG